MLGTDLKELLEKVNITPENYRAMKAKLGFEPTCNCELWVNILDQTHAAWKTGGFKSAKKAYNNARAYYAQPR